MSGKQDERNETVGDATPQGPAAIPEQNAPTEPVTIAGGALLEKVVEFYRKTLGQGGTGMTLLRRCALDDSHLIETFQLGYCDGSLLPLLPENDPKRRQLLELGVLVERPGLGVQEIFLDWVVLPVHDPDGGLVSLVGWRIGKFHEIKPLPRSRLGLWNAKAAQLYPEIFLTASPADALSLIRAGYPNVVGLILPAPSEADVRLLQDLGVRRIVLVAPSRARPALAKSLAAFEVSQLQLREGRSPSAHLVKVGPEGLMSRVDTALARAPVSRPQQSVTRPETATVEGGFSVNLSGRQYLVRGLDRSARRLRATLRAEHAGKLHVDTADFYNAKARQGLCQDLARIFELPADTVQADVSRLIRLMEEQPERPGSAGESAPVALTPQERQEAEQFGRSPDLLEKIIEDYETAGLVGERHNKLLCYLAAVSRKLDDPLSILVLSSSGAGKSALQDATLLFCPPEDVVKLTSLTGRALFYKGRKSLRHKILAVEEGTGAEDASYAIRNLVSAKELVIEATIKDLATGRMTTMENRVEGPTAVFLTTTDPDTDPETRSRFFVLTVDETREQTRKILAFQRKRQTLENLALREAQDAVLRRHRNFQRILEPLVVVNPLAEEIDYPDDRLQSRRDHPKYLNLIRAVAFLRQMGRAVKTATRKTGEIFRYVEVEAEDVLIAEALARDVLRRHLDDLNGVSYALLKQIDRMVEARLAGMREAGEKVPPKSETAFTRREIREFSGWSHMRVKRYLRQLLELELVLVESGRPGYANRYRLAAAEEPIGATDALTT